MKHLLFLFFMLFAITAFGAENIVTSPDNRIQVEVAIADKITWSASVNGKRIIDQGIIGLWAEGKDLLTKQKVKNTFNGLVIQNVKPAIPLKFGEKTEQFNELKLDMKNGLALIFRVFNNGVAYRISTGFKKNTEIENEIAEFSFTEGSTVLFPAEESFVSHYERSYLNVSSMEVNDTMFCSLPMLATSSGIRIGITEAELLNYPNMFLKGNGNDSYKAIFPNYPVHIIDSERGPDRNETVLGEADFLATISPGQKLPWRVFMIAEEDKSLVENNMLACLNGSPEIKTDWIKPGKVAWDWWNANNIYGVDFESGINTQTYKYYIDFASKYGLEYIILDEGWSKSTTEIMESQENINLEELISYGKSKNVEIILWVLWKPLRQNMGEVFDLYAKWGVVGVKVDFMQRADQKMVQFYEKVAAEAAKRKLLVDFHGSYKPSGIEYKYPNVVNYEGLKGLEHHKWSEDITPAHNLTLPFTRMLAGMMDYTPGAMRNMHPINFNVSFNRPMSMGTRCHQAAMYVIYEAPLQMLADNPSNYLRDTAYTAFVSRIPTTWTDLSVLEASVSEYLILARKNGAKWYIGGMTNEHERTFNLDFNFLEPGISYRLTILTDGKNANLMAEDYKMQVFELTSNTVLPVKMVSGGGFAGILEPLK